MSGGSIQDERIKTPIRETTVSSGNGWREGAWWAKHLYSGLSRMRIMFGVRRRNDKRYNETQKERASESSRVEDVEKEDVRRDQVGDWWYWDPEGCG